MAKARHISLWKEALFISALVMTASMPLAAMAAEPSGYTDEAVKLGEIDPNTLDPYSGLPMEDVPEAAEVDGVDVLYPPEVKSSPRGKRTKNTVAAKAAKPVAREIPLIETENEGSSREDIVFVTGGIGDDERGAIEKAKEDYNLHVTNTSKTGAFEGDIRVVITQQGVEEGQEVLSIVAGPLLYVRLPEGKYSLVATLGQRTVTKPVVIKKKTKSVDIRLSW